MVYRLAKLLAAVSLLAVVWSIHLVRSDDPRAWIRPAGDPPGPVRILQFYASVGVLMTGQKAQLCYGVENARSVRISPPVASLYPSSNRCLDVVPEHTTHYTILAEGYDGRVAMQSLTLPVQTRPAAPPQTVDVAALLFTRTIR